MVHSSEHLAVTRRTFVLGTAAFGAALALPGPGAKATATANRHVLALFDGELEDGRRFAALATSAGHTAQDTGRDLAPLLYGRRRDWARDPQVVLAGVTRYADFHVASGIARENGRCVIAAAVREKPGSPARLIASSSAAPAPRDRLPFAFDADSLRRLIRDEGSIAWICA